jgi:hypothetical protein
MIAEQTRELRRQGIEFFLPRGAFGGLFAFALMSALSARNPQEVWQGGRGRGQGWGGGYHVGFWRRMGCCGVWEKVRWLLRRDKIGMSQLVRSEFVISDTRQIET